MGRVAGATTRRHMGNCLKFFRLGEGARSSKRPRRNPYSASVERLLYEALHCSTLLRCWGTVFQPHDSDAERIVTHLHCDVHGRRREGINVLRKASLAQGESRGEW